MMLVDFCVCAALIAQSAPGELPELKVGDAVHGEVTDDGPTIDVPANANEKVGPLHGVRYRIKLERDEVVTISARSIYFDAHLGLRDDTDEILVEDDDGWYLTHSRIVLEVPETGDYVLELTALHAGRGPFELTVEEGRSKALASADKRKLLVDESRELLEHVKGLPPTAMPSLGTQFVSLANVLYAAGNIPDARACYEAALPRVEATLGANHAATTACMHNLAAAMNATGDAAHAIPLLERVVATRTQTLGAHAPDTVVAIGSLGVVEHAAGNLARARECLEQAIAAWSGPADSPSLLHLRGELGMVCLDEGSPREACDLLGPVVAGLERKLGHDNPQVIEVRGQLALCEQRAGRLDRAVESYEDLLASSRRALGSDNPTTATRMSDLGAVLSNLGQNAEAEPLLREALRIDEATVGRGNLLTITTLNNLALCLQRTGRFDGAEVMFRDALARTRESLGPTNPLVIGGLSNLASSLREHGRFDEALALLDEALELAKTIRGARHPDYARTLTASAAALQERGDLAGAKEQYERALAIQSEALGKESRETQVTTNNLALVLTELGDFDRARRLLDQVLPKDAATRGDISSTSAMTILAHMQLDSGDAAGAAALFERVHSVDLDALGPSHPRTAGDLSNLAAARLAQKDIGGAAALAKDAVAACEAALGKDHPTTAMAFNTWALASAELGDAEGARSRFESALDRLRRCGAVTNLRTARLAASLAQHLLDMGRPTDALVALSGALTDFGGAVGAELPRLSTTTRLAFVESLFHDLEVLLSIPTDTTAATSEAYTIAASWKGRVQRATLNSERALPAAGAAALQRVRDLNARISTLASEEAVVDAATRRSQLVTLEGELATAEEALYSVAPRPEPWRPVDSAAIRRALPANSAFVDLFVHPVYQPGRFDGGRVVREGSWSEPHLTAFVIRADVATVSRVDLGSQTALRDALLAYFPRVGIGRGKAPDEAKPVPEKRPAEKTPLGRVWRLLAPLIEGCEHVVVSPDGVLGTLPFEVLPDESGGFLIEHLAFSYVPDATSFVALAGRERAPVDRGRSAIVVGGVDYRARAESPIGASGLAANRGPADGAFARDWPDLAATRGEAELVAKLLGPDTSSADASRVLLLTGADATEEALKRMLERRDIIHVATHGYFEPKELVSFRTGSPITPGLLSGLVCAGANLPASPDRENGLLTASEVSWLDLSDCDLAVLSACETALGESRAAEGMASLQRAFLVAGARTVIASLWKVGDEPTAELMKDFYTRFTVAHESKAAALRNAQLDMLRSNRERDHDAAPATWGAFVLSGAVD